MTRYPLSQPKVRKAIAVHVVDGLTNAAIAARLDLEFDIKVSHQAISKLRNRHPEALDQVIQGLVQKIDDLPVSQKLHRLMVLDDLARRTQSWLDENSLTEMVTTKFGVTKGYRAAAVLQLRGLLKDAAEEMDQLPRAGVVVNQQNVVIIRQVTGAGAEPLG